VRKPHLLGPRYVTYRVKDPRSTVPGWGIKDGPQVKEKHGHDTTAIHLWLGVIFRVCDLDIRTDNPHADGATNRTDQKKITATDAINQIQQPNKSDNCLDYAKDTGGEQTVVSLNTDRLKMLLARDYFACRTFCD